jgi:1-aminocyclopropane-1-carboxylate deaminase
LSPTLLQAQEYGMQLFFISREAYKAKTIPQEVYGVLKKWDLYVVPEGGYGEKGAQGSMDILKSVAAENYMHIVAAVGTGTMLAGLINAAQPGQQVIGISVFKNNFSIERDVQHLLYPSKTAYTIYHDFHFGGYAKHTPALLQFMNAWFRETGIPTDFVYTAKTFYATDQLIRSRYFPAGSSILLIHSGGLQGNRSLPPGTLHY